MAAVVGCFSLAKQLAKTRAVATPVAARWMGRSAFSREVGIAHNNALSNNLGMLVMLANTIEWSPIVMMNRNARKPKAANRGKRPVSHHNRKKRKGRVSVKNGRIVR